jgi:hypothetical protein
MLHLTRTTKTLKYLLDALSKTTLVLNPKLLFFFFHTFFIYLCANDTNREPSYLPTISIYNNKNSNLR